MRESPPASVDPALKPNQPKQRMNVPVFDATPTVGVALRGDYFNDANAFRTGAAFGITGGPKHQLSSATVTLNVKSLPNVMIGPEIRFDKSNIDVFNAKKSQFTLGLGATYIF